MPRRPQYSDVAATRVIDPRPRGGGYRVDPSGTRFAIHRRMMSFAMLRKVIVGHVLLTGLLTATVGCGSVSPLSADASSDGTAGASAGATGQGGHGGAGGAGSCNTDSDCVYIPGSCCNGTCAAMTDPLPAPGPVCNIACTAAVPSCGCVNHQCAAAPACAPSGGGACQFCPNGYLTGPGGCQTCQCKPGDAGTDTRTDGGSPGSVTLRLVIPASHSFCDQTTGCGSTAHITILNAAGQALGITTPWCATICSTACTPSPCPGIACFEQGVAVKSGDLTWDGSSYRGSTCGNKMAC
jgi:hypothetical protein